MIHGCLDPRLLSILVVSSLQVMRFLRSHLQKLESELRTVPGAVPEETTKERLARERHERVQVRAH
jgi:hypothetical protein